MMGMFGMTAYRFELNVQNVENIATIETVILIILNI